MLESRLMKWNIMNKSFNYILDKLENPTDICLCHYSNFVENLRVNLIAGMKRIDKHFAV